MKKRPELVESFQQPGGPPFMVISVKAGGTGLNLTAASHVIHFDRWWNPAVGSPPSALRTPADKMRTGSSNSQATPDTSPTLPKKNASLPGS